MIHYTNVEAFLVAVLAPALGVPVRTELPGGANGLAVVAPIIRVVRVGGADVEPTIDRATVDIEYFAATRGAAIDGAESVRYFMRNQLPGTRFNGGSVKTVTTISAPTWRPWDDLNVRRVGASYEIRLHTQ